MTSTYNLQLSSVPDWNNVPINKNFTLNTEGLLGYLAMATALLGPERDTYFAIYDRAVRRQDANQLLENNKTILLTDESAFDITEGPQGWQHELRQAGANPIKRYTVRVAHPRSASHYVFQYNDPQFLSSMITMLSWFGINRPDEVLTDLHEGDTPLEIPTKR